MDRHSITPPPFRDGDSFEPLESDATVIGSPSTLTPQDYPRGLTSRELAHALRGEMLGHFLLQQFIGGGGMGVVFKALDTTLDRIVAVKVVASHRVANEDLQRRFLVEAQSTARLDHPNIARVHYIGRDRGLPYIVFEYIEGVNLRDLVHRQGPLDVGHAIGYVYQIAHALSHAWQRDVVHRDIKPSNILITPDGQAKLVDMGLARLRQMESSDDDLTATGITLGTFDYISPEQARDPRSADAHSDIYSLGCTLFFTLTGQAPFAHGTALQKLLQHHNDRPPDLREFRSDVPDSVARVLRRMLAKSPGDRQQTPVELVGELGEIVDELELTLPYAAASLPRAASAPAPTRRRRHAVWIVPAVFMLVLGVAVDRFSRDGTTAAPFAALKMPAETSPVDSPPAAPAVDILAKSERDEIESIPATPSLDAPRLNDPLPIGAEWYTGQSLWESVSNWPSGEAPTERSAPLSDPFRVDEPQFDGGLWRTPTMQLDLMEDSGEAAGAITPP